MEEKMPESNWIKGTTEEENKPNALWQWIKENRQNFFAIVAIIVALIIITIAVYLNLSKNRETAEKYLFIAQQYFIQGNTDKALETIKIIEDNFSKYPAYDFALFLKGELFFSQGNFAKAIEEYQNVRKKIKNKDLLPFADYSIIKSFQALKDYQNAISQSEEFIKSYPDHYLTPEIYLALAISYATTKQTEKAKETFEKLSILYPQTSWEQLAKEALKGFETEKQKAKGRK